MIFRKHALALASLAAAAGLASSAFAAQPIEGEWLVQDKDGRVRIAPCANDASRLCGSIIWMSAPNDASGKPVRDVKNQNAALRNRTILGLPLISGFKPNGLNKWSDGKIYNPKDGKTYNSKLELASNGSLKVAGCVSVICKTQVWTRVK